MPKEPIPEVFQGLPVLTAARMRELDRDASERHGLPVLALMENAGRAVARETARFLKEKAGREPAGARVVVCCGRGSNGGDGLVAARFLKEGGADVAVFLCPSREGEYAGPLRVNLERAKALGIPVRAEGAAGLGLGLAGADAALDALLGTGSSGKPMGPIRGMIQALNRSKVPVLAVDIPSGLQCDTGHHSGVYVTASATFALGFAKRGLLASHAKKYVGELRVLDIGYPPELIKALT